MVTARVTVDGTRPIGDIHPHIYGHFIEHLRDCIYNGLWAEMLQNRKFAGHDRVYYGIVMPWLPVGPGDHVEYMHDNRVFYVCGMAESRGQSQRIRVTRGDGEPHGIAQAGLSLVRGRRYEVRLVLRAEGSVGGVDVALETDQCGRVAETVEGVDGDWRTFSLTLSATEDAHNARFSITFRQPGALWIGAASLMPSDHTQGWRTDVLDLARGLKPPIVRYPGGNFASDYHWEDGIGDRDRRPVRFDDAWKVYEPNDVGTDEFIEWCRLLETEPYLCVNTGNGTPEEAAAWVEYCNGPADSTYGRLRAEHGHPEPYDVIYWGIGNETYGNWQTGHVDAETFAHECVVFARAMRAVDPRLKLLAVGGMPDRWPDWNGAVARIAGAEIDYITLHHYARDTRATSADDSYAMTVSAPDHITDLIDQSRRDIDANAPDGKFIAISFDEWNVAHRGRHEQPVGTNIEEVVASEVAVSAVAEPAAGSPAVSPAGLAPTDLAGSEVMAVAETTASDVVAMAFDMPPPVTTATRYAPERWQRYMSGLAEYASQQRRILGRQNYALADGLYAASFFNTMLRNANHITMANQAQMINLLGLIETSQTDCYGTPQYLAFQLYVDHAGARALPVDVDGPTFDAPAVGNMPARQGVPYLDIAASYDPERGRLFLHVVNRHPSEPAEVEIDVQGLSPTGTMTAHELNGPGPWARNTFADHSVVRIESHAASLASRRFTRRFPAHSATSLEIACE